MSSRPLIYSNMAITADGKITSATREYPRFTSAADKNTMDELRASADAVLIGLGTLNDEPPMVVEDAALRAERKAAGKPELLNVVVTTSCAMDPRARFFTGPRERRPIVATVESAPAARRDALREVADVWTMGRERVAIPALVDRLAREEGVERLLVEGGAELNAGFVEADLLDELYVTVAPALLGGRDAPGMIGGAGLPMGEHKRLELLDLKRDGDEVFLHYRVL